MRLFCFANAGGAASVFRLWPQALSPGVEVLAAQLPGHGSRWQERPLDSIPTLVDALVPPIAAHASLPFAFFGHSMGSTLAYALTAELARRGGPLPFHLFASSRRPPTMPSTEPPLHPLSDSDFVAEMMRRYGGIPAEVLAEPDLMALLLPALRADMRALETWQPGPATVLPCPVTAYGGTEDARTPRDHLEAWGEETRSGSRLRMFAGGHFYLESRRAELLADIAGVLASVPAHAREAST